MKTPNRSARRAGFTLTELLIAITVIGILAGLIAPAILGALTTTKEKAVIFEMKQMELAIEHFKNDHGIYPPTFGVEITTVADMNRYLRKIAPQNQENSTSFANTPSTETRLQTWWNNVGSNLDATTSLQFWLSGLCKNKQFPLTGGVSVDTNDDGSSSASVMTLSGFGDDSYSDGTPLGASVGTIERNNYFEFKQGQMNVTNGGATAEYNQPFGPSTGDLRYRYLDYKSYAGNAYHDGSATPEYINPKSFQIVTYGRDGLPGLTDAAGINITNTGAEGADNLCNFTEGRAEKYLIDN